MPAWMDIIGRAVPVTLRGRFFALSNLAAAGGGFAGSFLTAHVLAAIEAPASFGVCFLCASACMAVSYLALTLVREPAATAASPPVALATYLMRIPSLLRRDANLRWFLLSRAFALVGVMGGGFYTVYALRAWEAPAAEAGVFTALLLAGQIAGNVTLGWVADRMGHRLVIVAGVAATVGANALALVAPSLGAFGAVFLLTGVQGAAISISNLSVLLEFAPVPEERPTYVGLGTTLMAPMALGAPLAGGLLADAFGFAAVFAIAAAAGTIALVVLLSLVRDPREDRARLAR
jgi:predicted MFS family arabinose efflux permease